MDAGGFAAWTKLGFCDGATKPGEIAQGPTQFTATDLTPGHRVFSVPGTDAMGTAQG